MFLANNIIEAATASPKRKRQLLKKFSESGANNATPHQSFNEKAAHTYILAPLAAVADKLPNALRFKLDEKVTDAMHKMVLPAYENAIKAFNFVRLPAPITWIEFEKDGNTLGCLMEESRDSNQRTVSFQIASSNNGYIPLCAAETILSENGWRGNRSYESVNSYSLYGLSAILLLNSRSRILTTEGEPLKDKQGKARLKRSQCSGQTVSLKPITFDISRVLEKGQATTEEEARQLRYLTLRQGHFKIRKTGVFWWSPHTVKVTEPGNESTPEQASKSPPHVQKNREVTKRKPTASVHTPDKSIDFNIE